MSASLLFLHTRVRVEEKLLLQELERRGAQVQLQDLRQLTLRVDELGMACTPLVWDRSLSLSRSLAALHSFHASGATCLNHPQVVETCGNKLRTHLALAQAHVPTPRTSIAFSGDSALRCADAMGYPIVTKPVIGSWGRMVSRLNDRDAAEAVFEHREALGDASHNITLMQDLVEKPGRDLRVFVVGDEAIAAIERRSEHWITNTARGASTANRALDHDLSELAVRAARAVGGGQLAVDLVEDRSGDLLVLEVNHSMEFRNSIQVTGVDIPARLVDDALRRAQLEVAP